MNFNIGNKKEEVREKNEEIRKKKEQIIKIAKYRNILNRQFIVKDQYNSVIPLDLYTCWHTKDLPPHLKNIYEKVKKMNPEMNHHLYNDEMCAEFIKNNFDKRVYDAYNTLIPDSYRSDLWRFCVLYINGGIYYDIKFSCVNNFKFIALTEDEFFAKDRIEKKYACSGIIASKPNNSLLKNCIYKIVDYVEKRMYGNDPLFTGPGMLGSFISREDFNKLNASLVNTELDLGISDEFLKHVYITYNNIVILFCDDKLYRKCQGLYERRPHYHKLWHEKKIYMN